MSINKLDTENSVLIKFISEIRDTTVQKDAILVTDQSLASVYEGFKKHGTPNEIHIVCVIDAVEGLAYLKNHFPDNIKLCIATVDKELNNKGYIVP